MQIGAFFSNIHTIDKLLTIIESFSDDFRALAAETLTYIFRSSFALGQHESVRIFKDLGGSEKLTALLMTSKEAVRTRLLLCLQTLTGSEDQDIFSELRDLGIIPLLLN